jgi:4-amino-4-deoxy-L-arabinose transferase-like glycosyltransferase
LPLLMWKQAKNNLGKFLDILPYIIIGIGILLRITVYLQNRSLIIDEANVARNLFERDFAGLTLPLSYEQYAPPVFLWLLKLSVTLLGYSEYALKLYPLLCGIATLILLYKVLQHYTNNKSIWYVLALVATGWIYLRYSTEVKQYMPDAALMLSLVLLALKLDISRVPPSRFLLYWALAGSIAIWLSMPVVFLLAAIGLYYLLLTVKQKQYNKLGILAGIAAVWAVQFVFYYITILQPQIHSSHLQNGHSLYFLIPFPSGIDEWVSNWNVFACWAMPGGTGHCHWLFIP